MNPRLTWNTIELVRQAGGHPVLCKNGYSFIKKRMWRESALYGGEMSGHHYFRDFTFCDSGMIPWLLVLQLMCRTGKPLSSLVAERVARYPVSGEVNRTVDDPDAVLKRVEDRYRAKAGTCDRTETLAWNFPPGGLISANPTPSLCCASMWRPGKTRCSF